MLPWWHGLELLNGYPITVRQFFSIMFDVYNDIPYNNSNEFDVSRVWIAKEDFNADFLISEIRFPDLRKYFLISKNRNFWYHKLSEIIFWYQKIDFLISENTWISDIRNWFSDIRKSWNFLISENNFWYQKLIFWYQTMIFWYQKTIFWYQKFKHFLILENDFLISVMIFWYQKIGIKVLFGVPYSWEGIAPVYNCGRITEAWWRHQMKAFSALLSLCAGNSPVPGEFPSQRANNADFGVSLIWACIIC